MTRPPVPPLTGFTPLEQGADGPLNWKRRHKPGWEATYVAAWMPRPNLRDITQFVEKTAVIEDMGGYLHCDLTAPPTKMAKSNLARYYLPLFKSILDLPMSLPAEALVIEEDWNTFDIASLDDAT